MFTVRQRRPHMQNYRMTAADNRATDDEDSDSTPPSSPLRKPIASRGKFDDEEDDSDVRQPTMPRHTQLAPHQAQRIAY
jgi:hypothetical protein